MAEFYAYRIITGKTTFTKVPSRLKDAVKKVLEELGCGEFAEEEDR